MPAETIDAAAAAGLLRLLGNPARLRIVLRLAAGPLSVGDLELELGLRQPNLSQHLAELRNAGVVATRREGRSVIYALTGDHIARLAAALQ